MFLGFLATGHGIAVPQPGIETASPPLEGKVLTADPLREAPYGLLPMGLYSRVRTFQIVWGVAQAISADPCSCIFCSGFSDT